MEIKVKLEALRVVLDPALSPPELMQHVVLKEVPPHLKLGDLITVRVLISARLKLFLHP